MLITILCSKSGVKDKSEPPAFIRNQQLPAFAKGVASRACAPVFSIPDAAASDCKSGPPITPDFFHGKKLSPFTGKKLSPATAHGVPIE